MKTIPKHLNESIHAYAEGLEELLGDDLARVFLTDDEDLTARRAVKKLTDEKKGEAIWIAGWFRGCADLLECEPADLYARVRAKKSA